MKIGTSAPPYPLADTYPAECVGRLMESPIAVFRPAMTVAEATAIVRDLAAATRVFTYGHVVDAAGVLVGVLTRRDLLLHDDHEKLENFMLHAPISSGWPPCG